MVLVISPLGFREDLHGHNYVLIVLIFNVYIFNVAIEIKLYSIIILLVNAYITFRMS